MSQPVKVSDSLMLDARLAGKLVERSIAGQIEFWAKMGRAIEPLLRGDQMFALCQCNGVESLAANLQSVGTPAGRQRVFDYLKTRPFPHYEAAPDAKGLLVQIEANGKRTVGRFVGREFVPANPRARRKARSAVQK